MSGLQYLLALGVTMGAYAIYAGAVAPLIEGRPASVPNQPLLMVEQRAADEIKEDLAGLLPDDGWEWEPCNILETRQARLLFRDYEVLDDGTVQLEPLTMIFRTGTSSSDPTSEAPPIVLRAPRGAKLKFENSLTLGGDPGRLEMGQLSGEVQIYRPATSPDSDDAVALVTEHVQISPERIFTLYECRFQLGKSFGRGRHLTIDLFGPAQSRQGRRALAGIERFELGRVDEMYLHRGDDDSGTANSGNGDLLSGTEQSMHIRCAGPMICDFDAGTASFTDDVEVRASDGQSQLNCEDLTVVLAMGASADDAADSGGGEQPPGWKVQRLVATGTPAVLTAAAHNAQITADNIEYDVTTRTVVLSSRQLAYLLRDGQQIQSPFIKYTFAADGRLGTADAQGPGSIVQQADKSSQPFTCRWRDNLTLRDDESGRKVLSLHRATVEMTDMKMACNELHLWMRETPVTDESGTTRHQMALAKLFASGQVSVRTAQLDGDCSEATAFWPEPDANAVARRDAPKSGSGGQGEGSRNSRVAPQVQGVVRPVGLQVSAGHDAGANEPAAKTRFVGRRIQMQMLAGGDTGAIDELTVDGDVVVQRQQTDASGKAETALEIRGQKLRAVLNKHQPGRLYVSGSSSQPATIAAREITMSGVEVHLDQGANRVWIDGAGEMQLTPAPDNDAAAPPPLQPVAAAPDLLASGVTTVAWAGGMVFDGEQLYFETGVNSRSRQTQNGEAGVTMTATRSAALSIILNRRLEFQQSQSSLARDDLRVERLVMVGWMDAGQAAFPDTYQVQEDRQAWVSGARYDATGQLIATHEILAPRASFDAHTGQAECEGRGSLIVRQLAGVNQPGSTPASLTSSKRRNGPIDFIRIKYDDTFSGSIEERRFRFLGNVHTFYTDSRQWDEVPPESVVRDPDRRAMVLDCDELDLVQWTPAGREPVVDMTASGNARIKGSQFDANAERVSYFEGNNVVTVEAPTRGDAEFWFERPGQSGRGHLVAKRIIYNLESGRWEVDQMKQMNYEDGEAKR